MPGSRETARPIRLAYGTAPQQFGELYIPDQPGPYPVVILIHGGFWRAAYDLSLMTELAEDLVRRGIAVWNIEYRRIGDPDGGWPGTFLDVALACDYLEPLAIPHSLDILRVIAVGHSAGGHLACWLAARQRIPQGNPLMPSAAPLPLLGVISQAGVVDLVHAWELRLSNGAVAELLGGSPQEQAERYAVASPAALLPLGVPQVLLHGSNDDNVPLIISQEYTHKATLVRDPVTLIELPGVDHFALINSSTEAWKTTVAEIQKLFTLK